LEIERYFMPRSLERVRGIIAAINALTDRPELVSTEEVERFAKMVSSTILHVAPKYSRQSNLDREALIGLVYRDAFTHLLRKPDLLPGRLRNILLNARKG